ncbi:MAG: folylpolyglutamate synthase/dihydrofolate synthase family protein [Candidatus Altiarchaeota archaeon]
MNLKQADDYLKGLKKFGIRLRLEHIERLLSLLGNPHKGLKCLHIAGTNGKGSVCAYLNSILIEAGFKVGLYTSPHFYKLNERIKFNNVMISDRELARLTGIVKPAVQKVSKELGDLTFFEVTTAIAFLYFVEKKTDFVVLEVGLGGRLDATNVVEPLVSVITSISREHVDFLGSDIEDIAREKASIIKESGLVVTAASGKALKVIEEKCQERKAVLCVVGEEVLFRRKQQSLVRQDFRLDFFGKNHNLSILLLGRHQMPNAALTFSVIQMLNSFHSLGVSEEAIRRGFLKARIPCRLELVQRNPTVFLDGAHNPDGIKKLAHALTEFKHDRTILVFGCSYNKEYEKMLSAFIPMPDSVIITETKLATPLAGSKLVSEFKKYVKDVALETDVKNAVKKAISKACVNDIVVVAGSLYVAGEARRFWRKKL